MLRMTDFQELYPPREDFAIPAKWYVTAMISGSHFLCRDGSGVAKVGGASTDIFYFDDEIHAHVCANKYYTDEGRAYPHQKQWSAALNLTPKTDNDNSHSQTMEFI